MKSTPTSRFLAAVSALFLLLFLKRPDALLNPQLYAEDGAVWFHDQMLLGAKAVFIPYAGYLHLAPRLTALLGSVLPVGAVPAFYNVLALLIAAFACAVFSLPAFRWIIASDALRFAVCCIWVFALDTGELVSSITQVQWYLQPAGILLLLYTTRQDFPRKLSTHIAVAALLLVIALSVPMLTLAIPLAVWALSRTRGTARIPAAAFLAGSLIELLIYAKVGIGGSSRLGPGRLFDSAVYLVVRSVLTSFIGRARAAEFYVHQALLAVLLTTIVALLWLTWLWIKSDRPARWIILACLYFAVAPAALAVIARNLAPASQAITFGGERYFYLASCCLVLLAAITLERFSWQPWVKAAVLVAIFVLGLLGNFKAPPFIDFHWARYTDRIARWKQEARSGGAVRPVRVPINPMGWSIILQGKLSGNEASELATVRDNTSGPNTGIRQWWFAGPSNAFDAATRGPRWFGINGDIAVAGDWDGSGRVRLGAFRCAPSGVQECQWFIDLNNNGSWDGPSGGDALWTFGLPGDIPVVGDWDGSGISNIGVMRCPPAGRPGACSWYLDIGNKHRYDADSAGFYIFGLPGDKPVIGPFAQSTAASPTTDQIGVFRCPPAGLCQWLVEGTGQTSHGSRTPQPVNPTATYHYGLPGDQPVVGDWNAQGIKRIGVFRAAPGGAGLWIVDINGDHIYNAADDQVFTFGIAGDQPILGFWTLP